MPDYNIFDNIYGQGSAGTHVTGHLDYPNMEAQTAQIISSGPLGPGDQGYDTAAPENNWMIWEEISGDDVTIGDDGGSKFAFLHAAAGGFVSVTQAHTIRQDLGAKSVNAILVVDRSAGSADLDIDIFTWNGSTETSLVSYTVTSPTLTSYPTGGARTVLNFTTPAANTTIYVRISLDNTASGSITEWSAHYCDIVVDIPAVTASFTHDVKNYGAGYPPTDTFIGCEGNLWYDVHGGGPTTVTKNGVTFTNTSTNDGQTATSGFDQNIAANSPVGTNAVASQAYHYWGIDTPESAVDTPVNIEANKNSIDWSPVYVYSGLTVAVGAEYHKFHLKVKGYAGFVKVAPNAAYQAEDTYDWSDHGLDAYIRPQPEFDSAITIASGPEGISSLFNTTYAFDYKWSDDTAAAHAQWGGPSVSVLYNYGWMKVKVAGTTVCSTSSGDAPTCSTRTHYASTPEYSISEMDGSNYASTINHTNVTSDTISAGFTIRLSHEVDYDSSLTNLSLFGIAELTGPAITIHPDITPVMQFSVDDDEWNYGIWKVLNVTNTTLSGNAAHTGSDATVTSGRCASNVIGHQYKVLYDASTAARSNAAHGDWASPDATLTRGGGLTTITIPSSMAVGVHNLAVRVDDIDNDASATYVTYTITEWVNEMILKVYTTEENAKSDTSAYVADASTGIIAQKDMGASPGFFQYERYFFRIEANEPASEFYIDWDDGEDNSSERANARIIKMDNPKFVGITNHIFTKHGNLFPVLRVKNSTGFLSKYYTPYHAENDVSSIDEDFVIGDAGNQDYSVVFMETSGQPRIPIFQPANKPPVGVLKVDRKQVYAGIDNDNLTATTIKVVATGSTTSQNAYVDITYKDTVDGVIKRASKKHTQTISNVEHILEVRLSSMLESAYDNTYDRIYVADNTSSADICNVSLGNPIVKLDGPEYVIVADGSESLARGSNVSITNYYFDADKLVDVDADAAYIQEAANGSTNLGTFNTSDIFQIGTDGSGVAVAANYTKSQTKVRYTNERVKHRLNTDYRYLPEERLIRLQVLDSSSDTRKDTTGDKVEYSFVEHFINNNHTGNYINTSGVGKSTARPTSIKSEGLLLFANATSSTTWRDLEAKNRTYNTSVIVGDEGSSETNGLRGDGVDQTKNFLLVGKTDKFNRLFIRMNSTVVNSVPTLGTNIPAIRLGLYYPADVGGTIMWKSLSFIDTTRYDDTTKDVSLHRSGHIMWEMPEDWAKVVSGTALTAADMTDAVQGGVFVDANPATWDFNAYSVLVTIATNHDHGDMNEIQVANVWPYNNAHSQLIKIADPMHISLNDVSLTESMSLGRTSKLMSTENRFGKSGIRKIGAAGGNITFGTVDTGASDYNNLKEYQDNGTPVYLDINHKDSSVTRVFGVIANMSESHPTGGGIRRINLSLQCSYLVEFDSSGVLLSDGYVALGGKAGDKAKYIL